MAAGGVMESAINVAILGLALAAAASDLHRREIPDSLSLVLALIGVARIAAGGADWAATALLAMAVFAAGLMLFARGLIGGGDVKLLTALALALGPAPFPLFLLVTAVAGGVVALALAIRLRLVPAAGTAAVPFAVAIAAGVAVVTAMPAPVLGS